MNAFDNRIIEVGIQINGETYTYRNNGIIISGRKYTDAIMNECEVSIFNLTREHRNNILTQGSPLKLGKNPPVIMTVDVGRESYGTFRLFSGNVITCAVSQPPDIAIGLRSLNSAFAAGVIIGNNQSSVAQLSVISKAVADSMGLKLEFQATDKQIENYSHNGAALGQVEKLGMMGGVVAFIDNDTLVVLNSNTAKKGEPRIISATTGMIGIPQVTEYGAVVKMLIDNSITLGCAVQIDSKINPAVNGPYHIVSIEFEASNRDLPFYYTLACQTPDRYMGT